MEINKNIEDFGKGLNSLVHPTKLAEDEFPLMENYVVRSIGYMPGLLKRSGIQRYNTNQFDGSNHILSGSEFTQNGASDKLIVNNNAASPEIGYTASPYTGSFTKLGNAAKYGFKLRHAAYDNRDYIVNINNGSGANEVYYYDTVNSADRLLEAGLPPCPQTFTLANGKSGAAVITNARAYIITFIYDNKYESGIIPVSENSPAYNVLSPALNPGTQSILIQAIPTGNARVTARRIYATKEYPGTDQTATFYYLDTIYDNVTTDYEDVTADAQLVEALDTEILYKPRALGAKYSGIIQNRLVLGNVTETQYSAPADDTPVDLADSGDTGGLALNKEAKYTYKFAYLFYILNGATASWITSGLSRVRWSNYSGVYSALSAGRSHTLTGTDNSIDLTDIDEIDGPVGDPYAGKRIITFRNLAFAPATCSKAVQAVLGNAATPHTGDLWGFKVGDKVVIEGGTGGFAILNGTRTITAVSANDITVDVDTSAVIGAYTAHELKVQGQKWYALKISNYGDTTPNVFDFTDEVPDYNTSGTVPDLITNSPVVLNEAGLGVIVPSDGNKSYKSRIYYSEEAEPDHIKSTNYFDIASEDGDDITGIAAEDDGVFITKNTNDFKLYISGSDPRLWRFRKVVSGLGGSDGLTCDTGSGIVIVKTQNIANNPFTVYMWRNGGQTEIDLKLRNYISSLSSTGTISVNDIKFDSAKKWVWLLCTYTDDAANTYELMLVYDLLIEQWYPFVNRNARLGVISAFDTRNYGMLFGNSVGYLVYYAAGTYKDKLGSSHSDAAIVSRIRTKTFNEAGDIMIKEVRSDIETIGGTPSTNKIALKYKNDQISEQSVNVSYTDSISVQRLRNRTFTNARSGPYREGYIGLEDSNTTFGHVLKGIYIKMDVRHMKRRGK
jgi:hypothetical protein